MVNWLDARPLFSRHQSGIGLNMRKTTGNPEGYILCINGKCADPVYCVLGEGSLSYYSMQGGKLLGQTTLTGYQLNVNYIENKRDEIPHRILIRLVPKKMKQEGKNPVSAALFRFFASSEPKRTAQTLVLAPSTRELQVEWATAILNWHKHCWDDTVSLFSYKEEYAALQIIMKQYGKHREMTKGLVVPKPATGTIQPIDSAEAPITRQPLAHPAG